MTTAEARGVVRRLRQELSRDYEHVARVLPTPEMQRDVRLYSCKSGLGRDRVVRRMTGRFGGPAAVMPSCVVWLLLRPRDAVIATPRDPGQVQDAVVTEYLVVGERARGWCETGLWSLEVPDHALHRAAERHRGIDLRAALIEAHAALLRVSEDAVPPPGSDALVRAGPGVFAGQFIYGLEDRARDPMVYFRARTWLHADQLAEGQESLREGTPALGISLMLPAPLRKVRLTPRGMEVYARDENRAGIDARLTTPARDGQPAYARPREGARRGSRAEGEGPLRVPGPR